MSEPDPRPRPAATLEAAMVARRYYIDDRHKNEIATEMGISRFKVARLIEEAKASGIVRISIDMPAELDLELGQRLADAFGFQRAIVARNFDDDPVAIGALLGSASAAYLTNVISDADVLGISWGSTLTRTVDAIRSLAPAEIVQLVGGVHAAALETSGVELVRRLAEKSNGRAFPLHAPLLVRTPEMASELRSDPSLAETIGRFPRLTKALVGIGSWAPAMSSLYSEFTPDERAALLAGGAIGDICTLVFDGDGNALESEPLRRSMGISLDELRRVPEVIAVAGSPAKARAIAAILRSGVVHTLVTDHSTANSLLGP